MLVPDRPELWILVKTELAQAVRPRLVPLANVKLAGVVIPQPVYVVLVMLQAERLVPEVLVTELEIVPRLALTVLTQRPIVLVRPEGWVQLP